MVGMLKKYRPSFSVLEIFKARLIYKSAKNIPIIDSKAGEHFIVDHAAEQASGLCL